MNKLANLLAQAIQLCQGVTLADTKSHQQITRAVGLLLRAKRLVGAKVALQDTEKVGKKREEQPSKQAAWWNALKTNIKSLPEKP